MTDLTVDFQKEKDEFTEVFKHLYPSEPVENDIPRKEYKESLYFKCFQIWLIRASM